MMKKLFLVLKQRKKPIKNSDVVPYQPTLLEKVEHMMHGLNLCDIFFFIVAAQ